MGGGKWGMVRKKNKLSNVSIQECTYYQYTYKYIHIFILNKLFRELTIVFHCPKLPDNVGCHASSPCYLNFNSFLK